MDSKYITDTRQNKILQIIVSSHVNTGEPVGSRFVSKVMGLSSATIRNAMADLEEAGYITHPHTSAGRVPTDKGYRCYVESLMRIKDITQNEAHRIEEEYRLKRKSVEDIIKKTAEVLADITGNAGIVVFSKFKKAAFRHIDLISVGKKKILVVLVTSAGVVNDFIIETKQDLRGDLSKITNILNDFCRGSTLDNIRKQLIDQLRQKRDSSRLILEETSSIVESILHLYYENDVYLEGASTLLSKPEFDDPKTARSILRLFDDKNTLLRLLNEDSNDKGVRVHIGRENKFVNMQNCSLVTSGYSVRGEQIGRLGIIGPTRMEYDHLIPLVNYVAETVDSILSSIIEWPDGKE